MIRRDNIIKQAYMLFLRIKAKICLQAPIQEKNVISLSTHALFSIIVV
jgi:hypothetical protein